MVPSLDHVIFTLHNNRKKKIFRDVIISGMNGKEMQSLKLLLVTLFNPNPASARKKIYRPYMELLDF